MTANDLFSGCGGSSAGAKEAGVEVLWAANHSRLAVECHQVNHPKTRHCCQDLHLADWDQAPNTDCMLASPDCRGHTRARGKERPRHNKYRATAWCVTSYLEAKRPLCGIVENVVEFLNWELFPSWADSIRRLGYSMAPHIIDAADHGVPQNRKRLFLMLTRSQHPLFLALPQLPHLAASRIIDWGSGKWVPWRSLCPKTTFRIRAGRRHFGSRFVAPYYGSGSGLAGRSLDRPIGTITSCDRYRVVDGSRSRMLSVDECRRAMGFPPGYNLPSTNREAKALLGQAVCPPVMTDLLKALQTAF
jgi:DNA (cytosine-5)-methyltransferase 1